MTPGTRVMVSAPGATLNGSTLNGRRGTVVSHEPPFYRVQLDSQWGVPGSELKFLSHELLTLNAQGDIEDDQNDKDHDAN